MDSTGTITNFETPGKNCPQKILHTKQTPDNKIILAPVYNMLPGGGAFNPNLSNNITFFHSVKRIE